MKLHTIGKLGRRACLALFSAIFLWTAGPTLAAKEEVRIAGLTWPGYGFWYIAQEKQDHFLVRAEAAR